MNIEEQVVTCLNTYKTSHSKYLYNYCGGKRGTQLSLNKFRRTLENMCSKGVIQYIGGEYPYWTVVKELDK